MNKSTSKKNYWPLFCLVFTAIFAASAISLGIKVSFSGWMHYFMGLIFCEFALLKLFNPSQFAEGFQMYDRVAQRFPVYALCYPWIELVLGLCYLSFVYPLLILSVTILFMLVGAFSVIVALKKGLDVRCACMGTILDVPLSTVTLAEDLGMGAMALGMLIFKLF